MENMVWYHSLNKPALSPPDWIFAPVWSFLYFTMALSILFYAKNGINKKNLGGIAAFMVQIFLNLVWTPTFFGNKNIEGAFVVIILLLIALTINMVLFLKQSKTAFILLIPYFLWTCFAAYLNYEIMLLNK